MFHSRVFRHGGLSGTAFAVALLVVGVLPGGRAAASDEIAPRVDVTRPHLQPPYPDTAQLNGEQGAVVVDVFVRPSGRPTKARVSRSSGFDDLDNAAVEGVLNWRFIPAVRDGDAISDWTTVKIVFQLPEPVPPPR